MGTKYTRIEAVVSGSSESLRKKKALENLAKQRQEQADQNVLTQYDADQWVRDQLKRRMDALKQGARTPAPGNPAEQLKQQQLVSRQLVGELIEGTAHKETLSKAERVLIQGVCVEHIRLQTLDLPPSSQVKHKVRISGLVNRASGVRAAEGRSAKLSQAVDEVGVTVRTERLMTLSEIPLSLDYKDASVGRIGLGDFLKIPLGDEDGPPEEGVFALHLNYLELLVQSERKRVSAAEARGRIASPCFDEVDLSILTEAVRSGSLALPPRYRHYYELFDEEGDLDPAILETAAKVLKEQKSFDHLIAP